MIIASFFLESNAIGADWKFYGGSVDLAKDNAMFFYDYESINKSKNIVKVWIKIIMTDDIIELRAKEKEAFIEKTKLKIANNYKVQFMKDAPEMTAEMNAFIITYELAANHPSVIIKGKILYEIDCIESKNRVLALAVYKEGKLVDSSSDQLKWEHIIPESSLATLAKMVCKPKKNI